MSNDILLYLLMGVGALFAIIVVAFLIISKKSKNSEVKQIQRLREGTKAKSFSTEVLYQKLYVFFAGSFFLP